MLVVDSHSKVLDRNIVAMDDFDLDESLYDLAAAEAAVPDKPENQATAPYGEGDVSDEENGEADAVTYVRRTFPDNPSAPDQNIPAVINSLLATQRVRAASSIRDIPLSTSILLSCPVESSRILCFTR